MADFNQSFRILSWPAALNSREMGGYPLRDGRYLRWKALVRSEHLGLLTPAGQQALVDYGIRTVIDLRFQSELEKNPNPFSNPAFSSNETPLFLHIPLDQDQDLYWHKGDDPSEAMSDLYCRLLETNRGHVARVLAAAAYARPGGVLFHCHAGKDRTGLIAAMILGILGAPEPVIVADYAFTTPPREERTRQTLADSAIPKSKLDFFRTQSSSYPETMQRTLAYLERRYGGIAGYVQTTGLKPDDLAALRERFIDNQG
jgi:protein-tyrosine phosphatase